MPTQRLKPEIGDVIEYNFIAYNQVLQGTVIDLLSSQFTIRITHPKSFKDKTHFIFYSDDYSIL